MLQEFRLFSGLSDEELELIQSRAVARNFPKNVIILNEGDETASLYLIQSGRVKFFLSDADGKEVILNTQGPGEYFGELSLLDGQPRDRHGQEPVTNRRAGSASGNAAPALRSTPPTRR